MSMRGRGWIRHKIETTKILQVQIKGRGTSKELVDRWQRHGDLELWKMSVTAERSS